MQIPQVIRNIPTNIQKGWVNIASIPTKSKELAMNHLSAKQEYWRQTDFWKQYGDSFYERNIQPLDKIDFMLLTGSLTIASTVMFIALTYLGIGALPLTLGLDSLTVFASYSFSRQRIITYFNEIAWEHVDGMRRTANEIIQKNQKFAEICEYKNSLMERKFEHLKEEVNGLDREINAFKKSVQGTDLPDGKGAFITYLEGLQHRLAPYKEIEKLTPPALSQVVTPGDQAKLPLTENNVKDLDKKLEKSDKKTVVNNIVSKNEENKVKQLNKDQTLPKIVVEQNHQKITKKNEEEIELHVEEESKEDIESHVEEENKEDIVMHIEEEKIDPSVENRGNEKKRQKIVKNNNLGSFDKKLENEK